MELDNEMQRSMLLQIISAVNFKGADVDEFYHLKQAIIVAPLKEGQNNGSEK